MVGSLKLEEDSHMIGSAAPDLREAGPGEPASTGSVPVVPSSTHL